MIRSAVRSSLVLAVACLTTSANAQNEKPLNFVDIGEAAGVTVVTWHGRPDKPHLLESGGAGVALFDYDADGDLDLYVVNGWRLDGSTIVERGANVLYRNCGDGCFEDVTAAAGVGDDGWGAAVAVGNIDGDGRPDLFVSNFGPDRLYRNVDGTRFETVEPGPGIDGWSSSSVFFDADGDGDEDLFVTGYIDSSLKEVLEAKPSLLWKGVPVMKGPFGLEGLANRYFVNEGGTFVEATAAAGLEDVGLFYSFGAAATDLDADGLLDLYVANDSNPNYLYQNLGDGRFQEVGLWSGAALDQAGAAQAGMGIAAGDVDGDGRTDLLITHFAEDTSTLYRNLGDMAFEDISQKVGLPQFSYAPLSWGTVFADFDLDGDNDLFIANGHIYPQATTNSQSSTRFRQSNHLLEYHDGRFLDRSPDAGPGLAVVESSRGLAAGDIDNDGDVDLVIANMDAPPTVLRNDSARQGRWLLIDAPGASGVEVVSGEQRWLKHRVLGASYASASDPRFHFGLGPIERIDRIRVWWPGGSERVLENVTPDQILSLRPPL